MFSGGGANLYLEAADNGRLFAANSYGGNLREFDTTGTTLSVIGSYPGLTGSEGLHFVASGPRAGILLASNWYGTAGQALYALDLGQSSPVLVQLQVATSSHQSYLPLGVDVCEGTSYGNDVYGIEQSGTVYRFSATSPGTQSTFATMPAYAEAIAFAPPGSPFGDYLYVLETNGAIERLDAQGNRTAFATGFLNTAASSSLEFSPDGLELYVAADQSPALYRIDHYLSATPASINPQAGGTQTFALDFGSGGAGRGYWLFGSLSGTSPGFQLGAAAVPLNVDFLTAFALQSPNVLPYANSLGLLDAQGRAAAAITVPPGLGVLTGLTANHATVLFDQATSQFLAASNAAPLLLQ
ncbi:MAG: hypothetical protein U1E73_11195 [Planctomycetota bacterium]